MGANKVKLNRIQEGNSILLNLSKIYEKYNKKIEGDLRELLKDTSFLKNIDSYEEIVKLLKTDPDHILDQEIKSIYIQYYRYCWQFKLDNSLKSSKMNMDKINILYNIGVKYNFFEN